MTEPTLGHALMAHARSLSGGGPLKSYQAKGWHAQLSALTASSRGSAASDAADLTVTRETLLKWLAGAAPTRANQAKIALAYSYLARRAFPPGMKTVTLNVHGRIISEDKHGKPLDDRVRTLKVNGRNGKWGRIEAAWDDETLDEQMFEDLYYEDVICEDLSFSVESLSIQGPVTIT